VYVHVRVVGEGEGVGGGKCSSNICSCINNGSHTDERT
jgi:hypothetical protein